MRGLLIQTGYKNCCYKKDPEKTKHNDQIREHPYLVKTSMTLQVQRLHKDIAAQYNGALVLMSIVAGR